MCHTTPRAWCLTAAPSTACAKITTMFTRVHTPALWHRHRRNSCDADRQAKANLRQRCVRNGGHFGIDPFDQRAAEQRLRQHSAERPPRQPRAHPERGSLACMRKASIAVNTVTTSASTRCANSKRMPPSNGGTRWPQFRGQSGTARAASLLVTNPPAVTSASVHAATTSGKRRRNYPLMVKSCVLLSFAPTVMVWSWTPYFSCQTSMV